MKFTTIGYYKDSPEEPLPFVVEAADVPSAIRAAEEQADLLYGHGQFINTFVLAGEPEILSSWAG